MISIGVTKREVYRADKLLGWLVSSTLTANYQFEPAPDVKLTRGERREIRKLLKQLRAS
jgi:hypothetical protein